MSNLIGKSFKNGRGEIITVIDTDTDIAILNDDQRISINRLLDEKHYRPVVRQEKMINENVFESNEVPDIFNNTNRYNNLMGQLKTSVEKTNVFGHDSNPNYDAGTKIKMIDPTVDLGHTKADNIYIDDNQKIEDTKRRMIENQKHLAEKVSQQNQKITTLLDDESMSPPVINTDYNDRQVEVSEYNPSNQQINQPKKDNPAYQMFKNVKRTVPFTMSLELSKMLPKKEFIQLWEESYDISMIDYLAEEFLRELLVNPENIKKQIIEKIRKQVFPDEKKIVEPIKVVKKPTKKTTTKSNDK